MREALEAQIVHESRFGVGCLVVIGTCFTLGTVYTNLFQLQVADHATKVVGKAHLGRSVG